MSKHPENISDEEKKLFDQLDVTFSKTKDDVWSMIEERTNKEPAAPKQGKVVSMRKYWLAAASVVVLMGMIGFSKFYTITEITTNGQTAEVTLPDGSVVFMNHATSLSYQPYWWWASRTVQMEGEAFFEVKKGSQFSVYSAQGTTSVLGTSFNISTRNDRYEVFCRTGKVQVVAANESFEELLTPGSYVALVDDVMIKEDQYTYEEACDWRNNKFVFDAVPLEAVFAEIELNYDIEINYEDEILGYTYSGDFERPATAEEALDIVCGAYKYSYQKENNSKFVIIEQ